MFFQLEVQSQRRTEAVNVQLLAKWPPERSLCNDEALEVKVRSGHRMELKLLMYSFSPNDLLKEVFVMTKHLKLKCEVVIERNRSTKDASWFNISLTFQMKMSSWKNESSWHCKPKHQRCFLIQDKFRKNKSLWKNKASSTNWNEAWHTLPSQLRSCDLPNRKITERCHNLETHVALFSKITV